MALTEGGKAFMAIVNVTDQSFQQEIQNGTVLVDFWAPWCGPCKMIAPVLEELDQELGGQVKIAKVNVDDNPQTAEKFRVMSIPTLILFKNGEPVDKVVGFNSKDMLKDFISRHA
jgi:thioredoxin 1